MRSRAIRLLAPVVMILATVLGPISPAAAQDLPAIPDPVAVTLNPSTTAFLVLDIQSSNCPARPACVASLPSMANLLADARGAGVFVVYSGTPGGILDEVAPLPQEPLVTSSANKFFRTDLDNMLQEHGITTLLIVGTAANGAVLYTSFEAAVRGYTVVVAVDGISATTDFGVFLTEWQLLNGPGTVNPENTPLVDRAVTLSRMDLISFE